MIVVVQDAFLAVVVAEGATVVAAPLDTPPTLGRLVLARQMRRLGARDAKYVFGHGTLPTSLGTGLTKTTFQNKRRLLLHLPLMPPTPIGTLIQVPQII
jgi:hypothetical protein